MAANPIVNKTDKTPVQNARRHGRLFQVLLFWMFKETMKVRDVIAMVEADGWTVSR